MQQPKTQAEQQQVEQREDRTAGRVTSHAAQAIVRFAENLRLGKSDARFGVAGQLAKPRERSTQRAVTVSQNPLLVTHETPLKAGGRAKTGFSQKRGHARSGRQRIV